MTIINRTDLSKISVIVPAYNEESRIEKCLTSIIMSTIPRSLIELIVVDNNSTDSTAKIAKYYADKVIYHEKKDAYHARNEGAKHSSSNWLFFVDADVIVSENLLIESFYAMKNGFIGGSCRKLPDISSKLHNLVWDAYDLVDLLWTTSINRPYNFFAAYCFVEKKIFLSIGGFNPMLGVNADHVFCRQIAKKGPVAYIRNSNIIFSLRRLKKVGYFRYWIRTKFNNHRYYPHYK